MIFFLAFHTNPRPQYPKHKPKKNLQEKDDADNANTFQDRKMQISLQRFFFTINQTPFFQVECYSTISPETLQSPLLQETQALQERLAGVF